MASRRSWKRISTPRSQPGEGPSCPFVSDATLRSVPLSRDPFEDATLGPITLRNRVIKAATYEGMTPGGNPSEALSEHHGNLSRGGVGMTTVAYGAVHADARTFPDQLCVDDERVPGLSALVDRIHAGGARAALQLAHCGFFTKLRPAGGGLPRGPSFTVNKYGVASGLPVARAMTSTEIEAVPAAFADAAERARKAGFDAVELHLGHGYLLSQFLSPASNRRTDAWGGSRDNRMRLPLAVVDEVLDRVGERMAVTAKINVEDGFRGGASVDDAIALARRLDRAGVHGVTTSGGFTSRNPLFLLRGGRPLPQMVAVERNPLQRVALRVLGPAVVRAYPFEETFFRTAGRRILDAVSCPVTLLGGVVSRDNVDQALRDGFAFVQLGRALIADPDLVARWERGGRDRTRCDACNECIATMDDGGVRCVLPP